MERFAGACELGCGDDGCGIGPECTALVYSKTYSKAISPFAQISILGLEAYCKKDTAPPHRVVFSQTNRKGSGKVAPHASAGESFSKSLTSARSALISFFLKNTARIPADPASDSTSRLS